MGSGSGPEFNPPTRPGLRVAFGVPLTSLRQVSEPPLRELLLGRFWAIAKRKASCRRATPGKPRGGDRY